MVRLHHSANNRGLYSIGMQDEKTVISAGGGLLACKEELALLSGVHYCVASNVSSTAKDDFETDNSQVQSIKYHSETRECHPVCVEVCSITAECHCDREEDLLAKIERGHSPICTLYL